MIDEIEDVNKDYSRGYDTGLEVGQSRGYDEGYDEGFESGMSAGKQARAYSSPVSQGFAFNLRGRVRNISFQKLAFLIVADTAINIGLGVAIGYFLR